MVNTLSDVNNTDNYGAGQIQVLEGLEAVRKRPGMYIGSTSERGLHHLVWEIVDNSIDEALAGYADEINVTIEKDNWIKVTDNGRGIPVDIQEKMGRPAVEVILTVLHAGGKFGGGGYKVSGGLHGVGSSVVNALSEDLEVYVHRNDTIYHQAYKKGVPQFDLKEIGSTDKTGTAIRFKADSSIFTETTVYNYETLQQRIRELAFLNKGIQITLTDERDEDDIRQDSYHYEGGIKSYVEMLNENKEPIHGEPIYIHQSKDDIEVEIAIQYNKGYSTNLLTYANNIHTYEGGTHEDGFKRALTRVLNSYGMNSKIIKEDKDRLSGEDTREGLTAIISIKHGDPQFEGQTKTKLGNSEVRQVVDKLFSEHFERFLYENPSVGRIIVEKGIMASRARVAA
ncbi:ATP-binding protein, partial [Pseudomonas aeruginosa]|nr:ATP-binding protein [Pseudomonas aeruginosa]